MEVLLAVFVFVSLGAIIGVVATVWMLSMRYGQSMGEVGVPPRPFLMRQAQRLRRLARRLERGFTPASERLLVLSHGHVVSQYIQAVVSSGIADAYENDPRPAAGVADQLKLDPGVVTHVLRVLSSHGCFEAVTATEHMYRHNSVSALLRADHPQSLQPVIRMVQKSCSAWEETGQMLATGRSVFAASSAGRPFWEVGFPPDEPEGRARTGEEMLREAEAAMFRLSEGGLLADYGWDEYTRIIDVSGGYARFLAAILKANRKLVGVAWDSPRGIELTEAWWKRFAEIVSDRVKFVAGTSYEELPTLRSGDAILLGFVLSALDDEAAIEALTTLRASVASVGAPVLIADMVLEDRESDRAKLVMDAQARGLGPIRHRTRSGWSTLLLAAGFKVEEITECRGYAWVIRASAGERISLPNAPTAHETPTTPEKSDDDTPLLTPNAA